MAVADYNTYSAYSVTGLTCTDSHSNTYTAGKSVPQSTYTCSAALAIFTHYYATAPGSTTVTVTLAAGESDTNGCCIDICPIVLDGCASSQSGAATAAFGSASFGTTESLSITTTTAGSWVLVVAATNSHSGLTLTPTSLTTTITDGYDAVSGVDGFYAFGRATSATGTPGATSLGWTSSASGQELVIALEILPTTTAAIALADAGAAADQISAQITSIPVRLITAPPRPSGPPPPPIRAQILTVPQGNAAPADVAAAAETMTAGTVTVPLADQGGAADSISAGIYPADQAAAAEALAITAVSTALADQGGAAEQGTALVQLSTFDAGAAKDASQTTGLTQPDYGAAADTLTAAVTVHVTDKAAAADTLGFEPAIGASGGATRPQAMPGTSQVAVAPPGSSRWVYLGSIGTVTALKYSYTCPGGADSMTCTVMVPASYRNQAFSPGWQVKIVRGGHEIWHGKLDEPQPSAQGWNLAAIGNGMRGADFLAIYTDTWPAGQPDESINNAIGRGLPWVNPGVGTPAGAWLGQGVDSGASNITALLTLLTTRGALTWYVNSQPGGVIGDDLSVFPLPTVANRLLISTTPVPRTLGGDINTIYIRYQITADNTSASTSAAAPATYGTTSVQNAQSVAMHGVIETFIDISDVGVQTAAQAQAMGNAVLQIYVRASFAGPFVGHYGDLMNLGGTPVDPGDGSGLDRVPTHPD